jgi:hypothetical protein
MNNSNRIESEELFNQLDTESVSFLSYQNNLEKRVTFEAKKL